jgi:hypothetical protein
MEINVVLKINNKFHPNSLNVLHEFVMIFWSVVIHFKDTNSKGDKMRNVHAVN